jgi:Fe-S cluster biogenesis protein NfuA
MHSDEAKDGLDAKMERVEQLVRALSDCPDPVVRDQVQELVATLMDFHGEGLSKMFHILDAHAGNLPDAFNAMCNDPIVGSLLLMYELHPADVHDRVTAALEAVRPSLQEHQGDVELVAIEDDAVKLRLQGSCNGCPSSTATFRNLIETAIHDRAPEIRSIQLEGAAAA